MRLISTGSLGWWGARSALFSRHLVRGSESLRLLCRSKQTREHVTQLRATGVPTTTHRHACNGWSSQAPAHPTGTTPPQFPSLASKGQDQFLPVRLTAPENRHR